MYAWGPSGGSERILLRIRDVTIVNLQRILVSFYSRKSIQINSDKISLEFGTFKTIRQETLNVIINEISPAH